MFGLKMLLVALLVAVFALSCVSSVPVHEQDLEAAATGDGYERVQIKVFLGPTEHSGHDYFAPWGYWVKQPADEPHH